MQYSKQAFKAFLWCLGTYVAILAILSVLQYYKIIALPTSTGNDLLLIVVTPPFVALYLMVLIAATAGYARGPLMAKEMPLNSILRYKMQEKTMQEGSIASKIRSGDQVYDDTPLMDALDNMLSSRIPILAVFNKTAATASDSDAAPAGAGTPAKTCTVTTKVIGAVTAYDFLKTMHREYNKIAGGDSTGKLQEVLGGLQVKDLQCPQRDPRTVNSNDGLDKVLQIMITEQFTKLIVVDDEQNKNFKGTIDALDLITEVINNSA